MSPVSLLVYPLASLLDSYEMLVMALEASVEVLNMENVIEQLLHEERKMKDEDQGSTSAATPQEVMSVKHKESPDVTFVINLGINSKSVICMNKKRSWDWKADRLVIRRWSIK